MLSGNRLQRIGQLLEALPALTRADFSDNSITSVTPLSPREQMPHESKVCTHIHGKSLDRLRNRRRCGRCLIRMTLLKFERSRVHKECICRICRGEGPSRSLGLRGRTMGDGRLNSAEPVPQHTRPGNPLLRSNPHVSLKNRVMHITMLDRCIRPRSPILIAEYRFIVDTTLF